MSLLPAEARRLALSANLAVNGEGHEAIAALRACQRILEKAGTNLPAALAVGVSWSEAAPRRVDPPGPRPVSPMRRYEAKAVELLAWPKYLTDWEKGFLRSVSSVRFPSERQKDTLDSIHRRVTVERRSAA